MNINSYLDSTYLKTAKQAGISDAENLEIVKTYIREAIDQGFKLIMIRPDHVECAREMINKAKSKLLIGTVIDFPKGKGGLEKKLKQANQAIIDGADDLDFVVNYKAFKKKETDLVKQEILECTQFSIQNNKTIKWIIEVAALNNKQIIQLSALIKNLVITNFKEENFHNIFVKSSTGFFKTKNNLPNGATLESIIMMLENASPLPIKASGGIKNFEDSKTFIKLGVKRIGTSTAKIIAEESKIIEE
ncbi:MAG: deoxyribose-phosphate aldolase [Flavobacterium sp.]|nr:deoxyribose-phosphate aldolase [Flavobacterium sp.]